MGNKVHTQLSAAQCTQYAFNEQLDAMDTNSQLKTAYVAGTGIVTNGYALNTITTFECTSTIDMVNGDIIRFLVGAENEYQEFIINYKIDNNSVDVYKIKGEFTTIPSSGDTFEILKSTSLTTNSQGAIISTVTPFPCKFILNDSTHSNEVVSVTEDRLNATSSFYLPVKIMDISGNQPINITAGDLNVDITAYGTHFSSVRLSDGTNQASVSSANELKVTDLTSQLSLSSISANVITLIGSVAKIDSTSVSVVNLVTVSDVATHSELGSISSNITTLISSVSSQESYTVVDKKFLICSSTNITTAAYVELITSTAAACKKIQILDTTGSWFELATGASSSETPMLYVGPGSDQTIQAKIPASTRISVKALDANATSGAFAINLIG